ncbi:hypothetical protein POVWA2_007750 [Plasmodium ovale wallikeri]|uniref:Uncharacterized protein n=1 Tax=Plasmodium ovale wallikeri TaxID=864142 RepID=A0A1A8YKN2_PLAOA|nr:hypothetical protein POVWA1_007580 [Plasmodium ovale wallikeri]SBT32093.1 hypothetical protein POVWA2_007750 [Plasmodium ovale wallikeri]
MDDAQKRVKGEGEGTQREPLKNAEKRNIRFCHVLERREANKVIFLTSSCLIRSLGEGGGKCLHNGKKFANEWRNNKIEKRKKKKKKGKGGKGGKREKKK